jgi:hypothetical protein
MLGAWRGRLKVSGDARDGVEKGADSRTVAVVPTAVRAPAWTVGSSSSGDAGPGRGPLLECGVRTGSVGRRRFHVERATFG